MSIDLAAIGRILKERREEKGLSIAEVSDVLCLRKALIEAIEAGNWQPLPHEVYVKGFAKKYADLLRAYDEVAPLFSVAPAVEEAPVRVAEVPIKAEKVRKAKKEKKAKEAKTGSSSRKFSRARIALFAILAVAMFFFVYDRIEKERSLATKAETASRISESSRAGKDVSSVRPVSEVSTIADNKQGQDGSAISAMSEPKRLMISCHERTWISAVIDGKEKKEFMLSPHEIIVINAKERFDLLVGNAGGVKLFLNGKDTEFSGNSGEVKKLELS